MNVKNGIASKRSLEMMPNSWYVRLPRKSGVMSPSSIPMKPKNSPVAANAKAAG